MRPIFYYVLLISLHSEVSGFIFTKLRQKLKTHFKGKTKFAEFPTESGLEYPGNDPQLRQEIRKLWNEYYACLEKKYQSLGPHRSIMPEAIMVFEGSSVQLNCKMCISPAEVQTSEDVTWYFSAVPPNGTIIVEYDEHVLLSVEDKVLHMYNLQQKSSGQYLCKVGNTVMASYILEIVNDSEPVVEVRPKTAHKALHSKPMDVVTNQNLKVFTVWQSWSPCSKCGEVGKRVRFGICTVKLPQDLLKIKQTQHKIC